MQYERVEPGLKPANYSSRKHDDPKVVFRSLGVGRRVRYVLKRLAAAGRQPYRCPRAPVQTLGDETNHEDFVEAVAMGNVLSFNRLIGKVGLATLKQVLDAAPKVSSDPNATSVRAANNGLGTKTAEATRKLMPRVRDMYEKRVAEAERAKINMRLYGNPLGAGHSAATAPSPVPSPYMGLADTAMPAVGGLTLGAQTGAVSSAHHASAVPDG